MNPKNLWILGGTTAVVALIAALTLHRREAAVQASTLDTKLFPAIEASINEVAAVTLEKKDGRSTLERSGESWGLKDKKGYPIDVPAARKLLIGIASMTTAEPKTDDPKLYDRLGVQEPGAEGSSSTLVTLQDAG